MFDWWRWSGSWNEWFKTGKKFSLPLIFLPLFRSLVLFPILRGWPKSNKKEGRKKMKTSLTMIRFIVFNLFSFLILLHTLFIFQSRNNQVKKLKREQKEETMGEKTTRIKEEKKEEEEDCFLSLFSLLHESTHSLTLVKHVN